MRIEPFARALHQLLRGRFDRRNKRHHFALKLRTRHRAPTRRFLQRPENIVIVVIVGMIIDHNTTIYA
ncbi:MAG: hypothetical protein ACK5XA_13695, partial [Tagaea sp.]